MRWPYLGSSPLARGTRSVDSFYSAVYGLIPARAGNTDVSAGGCVAGGAHPRSRGEHGGGGGQVGVFRGSSPLARGTHSVRSDRTNPHGLIPARAGNTNSLCKVLQLTRAHPRSRGEHVVPLANVVKPVGSSPLARGTRSRQPMKLSRRGLIPARAGNTSRGCCLTVTPRAHPRSRGEHVSGGCA